MHEVEVFRPKQSEFQNIFQELLSSRFECLVFWQHDFLAYALSALGRPCLVVPMLDGSGAKSYKHWSLLSSCHFLSFSRELSWYLRLRGKSQTYLKYFPEPHSEKKAIPFQIKANQGYAWIRSRDQSFNLQELSEMGEKLDLETVKVRADDSRLLNNLENYQMLREIKISKRSEHLEVLNQSRYFFAPRKIEGIGMSFIESMELGSLVVSRNFPTANNYIRSGWNGYLIPKKGRIRARMLTSKIGEAQMSLNSMDSLRSADFPDNLESAINEGLAGAVQKRNKSPVTLDRVSTLLELSMGGYFDLGPGSTRMPRLSWVIGI